MAADQCPFCTLSPDRIVAQSALALAVRDAFPLSPGHTLIVPRRHVESFFEVTAEERAGMLALLDAAKEQIDAEHRPDGYNVGINDGAPAGQTVAHLHMHLIPRYRGDVPDPRGGVRWVLAERARYWGRDD